MENTSKKYKLNAVDLWKITRGAGVIGAGAVLTYLAPVVTQIDWQIAFKGTTIDISPLAVLILSTLIETARRWLTNYSAKE